MIRVSPYSRQQASDFVLPDWNAVVSLYAVEALVGEGLILGT